MPRRFKEQEQWGPVDAVVLYESFWFTPVSGGAEKRWGAHWAEIIGIFGDYRTVYVWEKQEMIDGGKRVIEETLLVPEKKRELWRAYEEVQEKLKKSANTIQAEISRDASESKIGPLAVEWIRLLDDAWCVGVTPELANFAAPAYLEEKLAGTVPTGDMHRVLEILLAPEDLSFHQQSDKELFELSATHGGKIPDDAFERYVEKWSWVENSYIENKNLTKGYFGNKLKGLSVGQCREKVKEIENYLRDVEKRKKEVVAEYKLPASIARLAHELAFSIWWQDHRKGLAWWSHGTTDLLAQWAEKRRGVPFADQLMYIAPEWKELLSAGTKVPREILDARRKLCIFDLTPDGMNVLYGKEAEEVREFYLPSAARVETTGELKGTPVSRGKATGRVRVLKSSRLSDQMQQGEVLVAEMTSPDFIVAMRKACAIVTDVGGLMSHAAIVSRELKIPCIVGTKIATKVLKDGDLVEVDAQKGIVKKLS